MARFFNPNTPPIDFGYRPIVSGGGGSGSRPSDPLVKEKYFKKENERLFAEGLTTKETPVTNVTTTEGTPPSVDDMTVAVPTTKTTTEFSSDKYAQALDKSYGMRAGNEYREQQLKLEQTTTMTQLENFRMGAMLIAAGRKQEGLELVNQGLPEEEQFVEVEPVGGSKFRSVQKDGTVEVEDINEVIASLVSSKDLFNARETWKLHLLQKSKAKEPLELKTDEVVGVNGQVFNTNTILKVYDETYGAIKKLADDPTAMLFLKSTDPAKYNKILVESATIPSPTAWAKEVYGVDITGKQPSRTVPAEKEGGKKGAKTPKAEGWMDTLPDATQYKGNRIKSSTGQILVSDGIDWLPEAEFKKKYSKK